VCGIIGCVKSEGNSVPEVLEGLKALEYRGYDSAGIAFITNKSELKVIKDRGSVSSLVSKVNLLKVKAKVAIGHTRWATHGIPSRENAHPFIDCKGLVAIVHNGTITNYLKLREELESRGHRFKSSTDSEVIAHLIEEGLSDGLSLLEALARSILSLRGSYAIAAISPSEPLKLVCARRESPLVIGIGNSSTYCASDVVALLRFVEKVMVLGEGELAELTPNGVKAYKLLKGNLKAIALKPFKPPWEVKETSKGSFPHYTLKEIYEQPLALLRALKGWGRRVGEVVNLINSARRIFLIGCGTSFHAALATSYIFQRYSDKLAVPAIASEFVKLYGKNINEEDVLIAISQSGETADTLKAVKVAKISGSKVISLVNVPGSSLERISDITMYLNAGPEIGVAATKSYTSQLLILSKLALLTGYLGGGLSKGEFKELERELGEAPRACREVLNLTSWKVRKLSERLVTKTSVLFLGRAWHWATAEEGALKLKELSYLHAEAYPAGEMKHGPIALVSTGFPVVVISGSSRCEDELLNNLLEVKARGGWVISVSNDEELNELSDYPVGIPYYSELITLITHVVPLQLLAYYTSVVRGLNPDRPRNLAKSVTVE